MNNKPKILIKCNLLIIRYTLLIIPLIWFISLWIEIIFGYEAYKTLHLNVYSNMTAYDGDGKIPSWDIPSSLYVAFLLLGTPTIFFIGAIYTALKKMWWWFAAYMLTGGVLIIKYVILPH